MPPTALIAAYDLAASLAHRCAHAHESAGGWQACCPAHNDTTPSLSITPTTDKVLLYCHAGCAPEAIVAVWGLTMADLFVPPPSRQHPQIIAIYPYHDAAGQILHETVRYTPKAFKQRRPDPLKPGDYLWSLKGITPVLYHLTDVRAAITSQTLIYIVEGEKDADAVQALGLVATCNPMGAGKWRTAYGAMLQGARCVLLPDNDVVGHKHALQVATALQGHAEGVKVLALPGLPDNGGDISDWLQAGGTRAALEQLVAAAPLWTPEGDRLAPASATPAPLGWSVYGVPGSTLTGGMGEDWRKELFIKKSKTTLELTQNLFNVAHILKHHPYWQRPENALWFDSIRQRHMCADVLITKTFLVKVSTWFGAQERLPLTNLEGLKDCLYAQCENTPRDLIQHWLQGLPAWDKRPRLHTWLHSITQVYETPLTREISRRLPMSMVARALVPGSQYREVVILEGKENLGKSELVEALAGKEWYVILSMNLEAKEAHMMLQRSWIAELAEVDSLSRTEEARLKAFITMKDDTYIPKYENDSVSRPRRTIFVGTTNDETYLKGQTGNSRFLPVRLPGPLRLDDFKAMRDQLFAEALMAYSADPVGWWMMPEDVTAMASEERELRRIATDYEQPLHEWLEYRRFDVELFADNKRVLFTKDETSWAEIATWFLKIDTPERWKDKSLQMQIAATLKAIGWRSVPVWKQGRTTRIWQKRSTEDPDEPVPF